MPYLQPSHTADILNKTLVKPEYENVKLNGPIVRSFRGPRNVAQKLPERPCAEWKAVRRIKQGTPGHEPINALRRNC
jgi:hypothetical protein